MVPAEISALKDKFACKEPLILPTVQRGNIQPLNKLLMKPLVGLVLKDITVLSTNQEKSHAPDKPLTIVLEIVGISPATTMLAQLVIPVLTV